MLRTVSGVVAGVLAVAGLLVGWAAARDEPLGAVAGIVVSVEGNTLMVADKDRKNERRYTVPAAALVTRDGKVCRLQDLKKGMPVVVTLEKQGEKTIVTRVEAKGPSD